MLGGSPCDGAEASQSQRPGGRRETQTPENQAETGCAEGPRQVSGQVCVSRSA